MHSSLFCASISMTLSHRLVQSIIALFVWCFVAVWFLYVQQNPRLFLWSILESINPELSHGDISYLVDTGMFYVFAKQWVQGKLSVDVRFDPDTVTLDPASYTGLSDAKFTMAWSGLLHIRRDSIVVYGRDPIASIPFVAANPYILVSDATVDNQALVIERL